MLSFHNDIAIKEKYINRVKAHQKADEIIKGIYWEDGKGCAVGCTIHAANHDAYELELGIPQTLARLEDGIFESLPNDRAKIWPAEFLSSIKVGSDLSNVWPKFAIWLLVDEIHGVLQYANTQQSKNVIQEIANGYANHKSITHREWLIMKDAVYAIAAATDYAAAAYAAYAVYAAAIYAAGAAAADYAVDACAAAAAAYAAYSAVDYAADVSRNKHRIAQADKLLELLMAAT